MAAPTQSDLTLEPAAASLPKPTYLGNSKGACERGPTSVSAEPAVNNAAPPGSLLNYTTVVYLQYAAKINLWATEDCASNTGEPPVYYALHLRSVQELELYGALAKRSDDLKLDKIHAAWAAGATAGVEVEIPTTTPGMCTYSIPSLDITDDYKYIVWYPNPYRCDPGHTPGSSHRRHLPDEWRQYADNPPPTTLAGG